MAKAKKQLHASFRPYRDVLIVMAPLAGMAVYLYGLRPLIMLAVAALTALLCDVLVAALRRDDYDASDISSIAFAIIFALMLPASARYELVVFGALIAVLLGKHAFGGYGNYPFHPSAVGFAATAICWPELVFKYPKPFSVIGLGFDSGARLYDAPAATLKLGGVPFIDKSDLVLGNYPGPMGATFIIILLASLVLLFVHGAMTWHVPVSFLGVVALWAFLFPRVLVSRGESVLYEMVIETVVFTAVYIAPEPVTSPSNALPKIIYGALIGVATMLFSHFGVYQMGACFAVLLVNPMASWLDRRFASRKVRARERLQNEES